MSVESGETFYNPLCKEKVVVRSPAHENDGYRTVLDVWVEAGGAVSGIHLHPHSEERFTLVEGRLIVEIEGRQVLLENPGDSVLIPPGLRHRWWNAGGQTSRHLCEFRNLADRFEELVLRQLFCLAQDGKTGRTGQPTLLPQALTTLEYGDVVRFDTPPWIVQRVLFSALAPIARWRGYQGRNPDYLARSSETRQELQPLPEEASRWHFTAEGHDPFPSESLAGAR